MDYLYMVNRKLDFIGFVYRTAVQPFQSAILAIELGEPPYYAGDYDGDGEPPFLTEWTEFNDGRLALGNLSLSLVAVALQEFLAASVENMRLGTPPKLNKKSWLERYRVLIKKTLDIDILDFTERPAIIEEIILARNRAQHPGLIGSNWVYQDREYARRYPRGEFINPVYAAILQEGSDGSNPEERPLEITEEKVGIAIDVVRDFCASMDTAFQRCPQYWN